MKFKAIAIVLLAISFGASAQQKNTYAELGLGLGAGANSVGLAAHKNWTLGKSQRFVIGTGVRLTSFFGKDLAFTSAPNALATVPASVDSLLTPSPNLTSLNALINIGYRLNKKLEVGFNIDAVGVSFGPEGTPTFVSNGKNKSTAAKPTAVNVLLVGNNDRGSLNSHFYAKYELSKRVGIKAAYQFLFNELTTATKIQTAPEANDRFRLKSSMVFVGLTFGI